MADYVRSKKVKHKGINNIFDLNGLSKVVQLFISSIYKSGWDSLYSDKENRTFKQKLASKFTLKIQEEKTTSKRDKNNNKAISFVKLPLLILVRPSKKILEKSKFFKKKQIFIENNTPKQLYAQDLTSKVSDILKIKEN